MIPCDRSHSFLVGRCILPERDTKEENGVLEMSTSLKHLVITQVFYVCVYVCICMLCTCVCIYIHRANQALHSRFVYFMICCNRYVHRKNKQQKINTTLNI